MGKDAVMGLLVGEGLRIWGDFQRLRPRSGDADVERTTGGDLGWTGAKEPIVENGLWLQLQMSTPTALSNVSATPALCPFDHCAKAGSATPMVQRTPIEDKLRCRKRAHELQLRWVGRNPGGNRVCLKPKVSLGSPSVCL